MGRMGKKRRRGRYRYTIEKDIDVQLTQKELKELEYAHL